MAEEDDDRAAEIIYALQDEIMRLQRQLAEGRARTEPEEDRGVWPESLLEAVEPGGGYTYMVPPPARKWAQGWRKRR